MVLNSQNLNGKDTDRTAGIETKGKFRIFLEGILYSMIFKKNSRVKNKNIPQMSTPMSLQ